MSTILAIPHLCQQSSTGVKVPRRISLIAYAKGRDKEIEGSKSQVYIEGLIAE